MHLPSRVATVASVCTIVAVALTGFGISPAAASGASSRVRCAGPTKAEKHFIVHARAYGIHAQEALYDRALIGCIPLGEWKAKAGPAAKRPAAAARSGRQSSQRHAQRPGVYRRDWSLIGPSPIGSGSFADSGRQLSSAYDANLNAGTLFVGTADGGVWSSTSHLGSPPGQRIPTFCRTWRSIRWRSTRRTPRGDDLRRYGGAVGGIRRPLRSRRVQVD